jgi:hypothetical protein
MTVKCKTTGKWFALPISKQSLRTFLEAGPTDKALKARAFAIENSMLDIKRFAPWPALEASMLEDVVHLRSLIKESTK